MDYITNGLAILLATSIILPILWRQITRRPLLYISVASLFCITTAIKQFVIYFSNFAFQGFLHRVGFCPHTQNANNSIFHHSRINSILHLRASCIFCAKRKIYTDLFLKLPFFAEDIRACIRARARKKRFQKHPCLRQNEFFHYTEIFQIQ